MALKTLYKDGKPLTLGRKTLKVDVNEGIETETYTFDQRRTEVANFLDNVTYDPSDYSSSQIGNYVTSKSSNHPVGVTINMKATGTLTVIDGYTGRTVSKTVSAGDVTIYNCTPGATSKFVLTNADGSIVQNGVIKPTGACRMIHMTNVDNIRDLGGWACDGGVVKYGKLFRGGEMYGFLTDDGKQQALDMLGILKEIDLRFAEDLNGRTESGFGPTVDMLWVDMTWNSLTYQKSSGNIKAIFDPLFDYVIAGKPTYFHCSAGADRTGVVALICEAILGVSQSDCDKDYELTNFYTGVGTDADARRRDEAVWTREITYLNTYSGATFREKTMNFLLSCGITLEKINAFRAAMIDGTPTALTADIASYTITKTLNGVTVDNSAASAKQYQPFTTKVTPASGKAIGTIKVTMGGVDITEAVFSGTADVLRRTVTRNLTECLSSNTRASVIDGQSYVTTLTANSGFTLNSVSITMGGVDVSTYYKDGIISIPEVTGDIVITATAVAQGPAYTNQLVNAIDMSGNAIGKTAMYTNKRYNSSSGAPVDYTGTLITGLIPCAVGDMIRIRWTGKNDDTYQQIKTFKSDRTQCLTGYCSFAHIADGTLGATLVQKDLANGIFDFKIGAGSAFNTMAYMAIVLNESDINNVIVTVNEEIT
nr:MAG TPA: tyrosine phosphatase family protein [Bacteriophage sp.]